jgi:hypothetical protein
MGNKLVFISHITEEAELAKLLSDVIKKSYLGMLDTFVSSDGQSIPSGARWLDTIDKALNDSAIQISLCSPQSIKRPWINFEAGASWIRKIPVIPLCHSGLQKGSLPIPLALLQSADIDNIGDLTGMFSTLTATLGAKIPPTVDYSSFIANYKIFANDYTYVNKIKNAVYEILSIENNLRPLFLSGSMQSASVTLADYQVMQIAPKLDILRNESLLSYVFNGTQMTAQGTFKSGNITLSQKYLADILPKL